LVKSSRTEEEEKEFPGLFRTYALTDITKCALLLVTRQSLVMLLWEALPPVKLGGRASE